MRGHSSRLIILSALKHARQRGNAYDAFQLAGAAPSDRTFESTCVLVCVICIYPSPMKQPTSDDKRNYKHKAKDKRAAEALANAERSREDKIYTHGD